MLYKSLFTLFALMLGTSAHAGGSDKLRHFISSSLSGQANFTQVVQDKKGRKIQSATGTMQFVRPGKFRWVYQKPYEQIIVGDGEKFWLFDVDLNQVTVKKLDAALGSSPAALLSGNSEIERAFLLTDTATKDGLEWLEASAKASDTGFEKITMAFNAQGDLVVMELLDSFGLRTELRFSNMQRNPKLPATLFKFVPPKGVDVLGE
jgi:outer membrane lipoprotein carrier protein